MPTPGSAVSRSLCSRGTLSTLCSSCGTPPSPLEGKGALGPVYGASPRSLPESPR